MKKSHLFKIFILLFGLILSSEGYCQIHEVKSDTANFKRSDYLNNLNAGVPPRNSSDLYSNEEKRNIESIIVYYLNNPLADVDYQITSDDSDDSESASSMMSLSHDTKKVPFSRFLTQPEDVRTYILANADKFSTNIDFDK